MMMRMADLIEGMASEALDNAEPWLEQGSAGCDAVCEIDEIVVDCHLLVDMLRDILKRENTGEGHAVTDAELAMAQNHREILAMRIRVVRRAME